MQQRIGFILAVALFGSVIFVASAHADNSKFLEAERFAARARLATLSGSDSTAGAAYEKAYQVLNDPAYLFAAGDAYARATAWASAARVYSILSDRALAAEDKLKAQSELNAASAKLEGIRSRLAVHLSPPGARVEVDGQALPFSNPATTWLEPGNHVVRISHPGYNSVENVVNVSLETPAIVHMDLERVAGGVGTLRVASNVEGADVFINGERVGVTPVAALQKPQGIYDIRVSKDGYGAWERAVSVKRNIPTEVDVRLEAGVQGVPAAAPVPTPAAIPVAAAVAPVAVAAAAPSTPQVREVPLEIPGAAAAQAAAPEEASPVEAAPQPLLLGAAQPNDYPIAVAPQPEAVEAPAAPEEAPEPAFNDWADSEDSYEEPEESVSYSDDSGGGGGGGDITLIAVGWSMVAAGAGIAGAGVIFAGEASDAEATRDAIPQALPEQGSPYYQPGMTQEIWQQQFYGYYWGEEDTKASSASTMAMIMYGSGGAVLVTGAVLAIMGHMDSGSSYAQEETGPRWIGLGVAPTDDGTYFSTGLRF